MFKVNIKVRYYTDSIVIVIGGRTFTNNESAVDYLIKVYGYSENEAIALLKQHGLK